MGSGQGALRLGTRGADAMVDLAARGPTRGHRRNAPHPAPRDAGPSSDTGTRRSCDRAGAAGGRAGGRAGAAVARTRGDADREVDSRCFPVWAGPCPVPAAQVRPRPSTHRRRPTGPAHNHRSLPRRRRVARYPPVDRADVTGLPRAGPHTGEPDWGRSHGRQPPRPRRLRLLKAILMSAYTRIRRQHRTAHPRPHGDGSRTAGRAGATHGGPAVDVERDRTDPAEQHPRLNPGAGLPSSASGSGSCTRLRWRGRRFQLVDELARAACQWGVQPAPAQAGPAAQPPQPALPGGLLRPPQQAVPLPNRPPP